MAIVERLQEWYSAKGRADQAERGFKVGPSNLGDCARKLAHLMAGMEPAPLAPEAVRTFELGHQRGEALEAACRMIWPDAQSQVPIRIPIGRFEIRGTCDLWVPSIRTVVDFKTQSMFGFGLLDTEGVSEEYQLQVHAYRDAIGRELCERGENQPIRAVLVYEAKDSDARKGIKAQALKELEVPWTEELEEKYQQRLALIEGMLIRKEQNALVPKDYPELPLNKNGTKSFKCRYCSVGLDRGGCYLGDLEQMLKQSIEAKAR